VNKRIDFIRARKCMRRCICAFIVALTGVTQISPMFLLQSKGQEPVIQDEKKPPSSFQAWAQNNRTVLLETILKTDNDVLFLAFLKTGILFPYVPLKDFPEKISGGIFEKSYQITRFEKTKELFGAIELLAIAFKAPECFKALIEMRRQDDDLTKQALGIWEEFTIRKFMYRGPEDPLSRSFIQFLVQRRTIPTGPAKVSNDMSQDQVNRMTLRTEAIEKIHSLPLTGIRARFLVEHAGLSYEPLQETVVKTLQTAEQTPYIACMVQWYPVLKRLSTIFGELYWGSDIPAELWKTGKKTFQELITNYNTQRISSQQLEWVLALLLSEAKWEALRGLSGKRSSAHDLLQLLYETVKDAGALKLLRQAVAKHIGVKEHTVKIASFGDFKESLIPERAQQELFCACFALGCDFEKRLATKSVFYLLSLFESAARANDRTTPRLILDLLVQKMDALQKGKRDTSAQEACSNIRRVGLNLKPTYYKKLDVKEDPCKLLKALWEDSQKGDFILIKEEHPLRVYKRLRKSYEVAKGLNNRAFGRAFIKALEYPTNFTKTNIWISEMAEDQEGNIVEEVSVPVAFPPELVRKIFSY